MLGNDHPDTLSTRANLASLYHDQGRFREAEPLIVGALEIQNQLLGAEHPATLESKSLLGGLYCSTGRLDQAKPLLLEVLEQRVRNLGEEHHAVGDSYYRLGCLAAARGNGSQAIAHLRRAVELGWCRSSILNEPSLDRLRGLTDFEAIVSEVRAKIAR